MAKSLPFIEIDHVDQVFDLPGAIATLLSRISTSKSKKGSLFPLSVTLAAASPRS